MRDQKVTPNHLLRRAFLYIRQATMTMEHLFEHHQSIERQYALKNRAVALGWDRDQLVIIDDDLGLSGTSTQDRKGFQYLVAEVGSGRVGMIMGSDVSRLTQNIADWQHLIEICAMTDTLILVEDGVYDPTNFNDRVVLGLKGTMREDEIQILQARLEAGKLKLKKAKRGELKLPMTPMRNDCVCLGSGGKT